MANPNLFQAYLTPPRSIQDYSAQLDQSDARKNALQQSALAIQQSQQTLKNNEAINQQRNALRDMVQSGKIDLSNPEHTGAALSVAPDVAPGLLKTVQEGLTSRAKAGLDTAQAGNATADAARAAAQTKGMAQDQDIKAHDQHLKQLQSVSNPNELMDWVLSGVGGKTLDISRAAALSQKLQQDPNQWQDIKEKMLMNGVAIQEKFKEDQANARSSATLLETTRSHKANEGISAGQLGVARGRLALEQAAAKAPPKGFAADPENPGQMKYIVGGPADPEVKTQIGLTGGRESVYLGRIVNGATLATGSSIMF